MATHGQAVLVGVEATALAASTLQVNELLLKCNALAMELTQARSTIWRLQDQARDDRAERRVRSYWSTLPARV